MAANYPASLPALKTDYDSEDVIASADQNRQGEEINAIAAKVGITSSADTSSLDYLVKNTASSNPGHYHTGLAQVLTVAASDAPAAIKKKADYICDGTSDNVEIQAALTAGGTIRLTQGTFTVSAAIELDDNYTIIGSGVNKTIIKLVSGGTVNVLQTKAAATGNIFFVTLRDFCIDGNRANAASGLRGVYAKFAHTWLFDRVFIKDTKSHGIDFVATATNNIALNNMIRSCRIQDSEGYNVVYGAYAPNNHVINSVFGSSFGGNPAIGLLNDENTFIGNHISGAATNAISISGSNNIIVGNYIEASTTDGIYIANGVSGNRIEGNVIFNSGYGGAAGTYAGVRVAGQDTAIVGNRCFDRQGTKTQDYGIYIESTATGTIVADNNIKASDHTTGDIFVDSAAVSNSVSYPTGSNGWVQETDTWTYASASTFTVPGDQTAKFTPGTKLKLTQTTVKYATVKSSSYGAPTTTVTIFVNTDYTLANAAITSPYYSYAENPAGFPSKFTYASTITSEGGTITTVSSVARYKVIGSTIYGDIKITITTNGTGATSMKATLPANPADDNMYNVTGNLITTAEALTGVITTTGNVAQFRTYNNGYPGADGNVMVISFRYEY